MAPSSPPTTRSRTGLFLSYRDSRALGAFPRYTDADSGNEHEHLISASTHLALDVHLPPKWSVHPFPASSPHIAYVPAG